MSDRKISPIAERVEAFCDSRPNKNNIYDPEVQEILKDILVSSFEMSDSQHFCFSLIKRIQYVCEASNILTSDTLSTIGFDLYDEKNPALAQFVYQQAISIEPTFGSCSNLAYICRRHSDVLHISAGEIIDLLMKGVRGQYALSVVNMSLVFAQMLGTQEDWLLADRIIGLIRETSTSFNAAITWWKKLAEENDPEGILVLCWLDRHDKYHFSASKLQKQYMLGVLNAPEWLLLKKMQD